MTPRDIDRATIRTWPAAVTEARDGWFLLAAGGVTGRVNAVWPLDWTGADIEAAIDDAEAWLVARGLPPRFKLTDAAYAPADLPERLARRGYQPITPTLVMTAPVTRRNDPDGVVVTEEMPLAFDQALRAISKDAAEYDERRSIALRAPQPTAFAMIERSGAPVAIGMCAATASLAGVFLMRTAPQARRQGLARQVLAALLARAARWEVQSVFLQVEADNIPAISLYESEGFATLTTYRFWRR